MNAANLIKLDDSNDKEQLKDLEIAANKGQVDAKVIFNIYKQQKFDLSTLINAKNIYKTLEPSDGRSLIYQKILLSEDYETKSRVSFFA